MPSPKKHLDKSDLKRWGVIVLIGAAVGGLNAFGTQVVPELQEIDNATVALMTIIFTTLADLARRFLSDTRLIPEKEAEKMIVVDNETPTGESVDGWFKRLTSFFKNDKPREN